MKWIGLKVLALGIAVVGAIALFGTGALANWLYWRTF